VTDSPPPRLRLIPVDELDAETARTVRVGNASVPNIFRALANHSKLLKRWMVFGTHVLAKNSLSPRDRELLILRTGWLCQSPYEFGQHTVIGLASGIDAAEIRAITAGPDAPSWSAFDRTLLRAADELVGDKRLSDATWQALAARYDERQLLDVIFTVGQYTLVSMALNSLRVPIDPGFPGFPKD
jgi:4-carboxymuconolactone decarboxylase